VEHVAHALTPHKRPREIRFVASLPRNALGKVQKRMLVGAGHP
jgi:acyl-coenzyme A synthetase/AMP-(fatty) acid ligase